MTCIVGLELGGGRVLFGADSMASCGDSYTINSQPKVWQHGDLVFAAAGHMYLCDHLQYSADLPRRVVGDPERWLRNKLLPALEASIRGASKASEDEQHGVEMMIGVAGLVFYVTPQNGEASRPVDGFAAIGNGSEVAIGSLYTTARLEGFVPEPSDRIEMAINAAASRCLGVGGPIVMLEGSTATRPATARKGKASGGKASGGGKVGRRAKPKAGKRRA